MMRHKRLFLLIEGDDDQRFFETVIKPRFEKKYSSVAIWKYAQQKRKKVGAFLRSIKSMGADYVYSSDINRSPCVMHKKQEIQGRLKTIDSDKIVVLIQEIESWYLAGLDTAASKRLGIPTYKTTNDLTKEDFDDLIPSGFDSRIDFMVEILKCFSTETAGQKNRSFDYLLKKHNL